MRKFRILPLLFLAGLLPASLDAQDRRAPSPRGQSAIEVGGTWTTQEDGQRRYEGGQWLEVDYGRPVLRGRENIFGSGDDYGQQVAGESRLWRVGANATTRLSTGIPLVFGETTLAPGDYSLFIQLAPDTWTLVISNQPRMESYDPESKTGTWGTANYDPSFDLLRLPMEPGATPHRVEQFTISFVDVDAGGGALLFAWESTQARAPFKFGG